MRRSFAMWVVVLAVLASSCHTDTPITAPERVGALFKVVESPNSEILIAPVVVLREAGQPTTTTITVDADRWLQFLGSFELIVVPTGTPVAAARGTVQVDGEAVVRERDFAEAKGQPIVRALDLLARSVIEVRPVSAPGTGLTIMVRGVLKPVQRVMVEPVALALPPGATAILSAVSVAEDGTILQGRVVSWASADENVATVTDQGAVTAGASGQTLVKASVEGVEGAASISILGPPTIPIAFRSLHTGGFHGCGVALTGATYCWGLNRYGQVGDGTLANRYVPTLLATSQVFTSFGLGADFSCGLTAQGKAFCWGWNLHGELGNRSYEDSAVPVEVATDLTFEKLSVGYYASCGLTADGTAYCWGMSGMMTGQPQPRPASESAPVAIKPELRFASLVIGSGHYCGILTNGRTVCWGSNGHGELGHSDGSYNPEPREPDGGITFASLAAGDGGNTCGITNDGKAYCWGRNSWGEIGDGTTEDRSTPTLVDVPFPVKAIDVGENHSCLLSAEGLAYCWGYGDQGQTGVGYLQTRVLTPTAVAGGYRFASLHLGGYYSGALSASGGAYMWGHNWAGQLGVPNPWLKEAP